MANLSQLIARAQSLCEQRGVRLTAQRERVYEIIVQSKRAISAYDLLDVLRETEPQAKPPTVYRALDFLLSQGFVHKVESTNSFIACCLPGHEQHCSQLLICDSCGTVEECHTDTLSTALQQKANQVNFAVSHHVVETHGTCHTCQVATQKMQ
ncbi:Zinc uptake regulation protein [Grimontia celer]|uniref:Ferric uptake regulation protein n=2 Tax=Grimontia TaxID=246861 RepID=A0A128FBJ9_9GAMM|nr:MULTISPECIES: zinc uptake transcriptional repressor Zur [Grimontia]NGN99016.1 zinc uptake transcriptional repressor Zur [Grimontia sedimenti]CZF84172.1 Zinc uptake regulation protein [Grimontia celer]